MVEWVGVQLLDGLLELGFLVLSGRDPGVAGPPLRRCVLVLCAASLWDLVRTSPPLCHIRIYMNYKCKSQGVVGSWYLFQDDSK